MKSSSHGVKSAANGLMSAALSLAAGCALEVSFPPESMAQETQPTSCNVDWTKLNLTPVQSSQIQTLEQQWYKDFNELSPQIRDEQSKLQKLLSDHNADPIQVMALQQSIARRREQLSNAAMQNYLNKRKVLDEKQQKQLEDMMRVMISNRKAQMYPGSQTEVMPDKIQNLMRKVREILPMDSK
jgi:Spy/CpxP family protein refolding chaperone